MAKIGIIGGTFDPIHNAHIFMAQRARELCGLSSVIFIPGGNPPHKSKSNVTDKRLRLEMTEAAVDGMCGMEVSDYEITHPGYSYTADTLRHMTSTHPENSYYFIMGADSLDYIETWHEPEVILSLAEIIVFSRRGYEAQKKADEVTKRLGGRITVSEAEVPDISSTLIRKYVDMGFDVSAYTPKSVQCLIEEYGLYRAKLTELRESVKKVLLPKRFLHTMGVCMLATELARSYGEDEERAYTAAVLHDAAKNIPDGEMYELCRKYGVLLDEFERNNPQTVHARLGAYMAEHVYKISDPDIINAISWHTLGRCEMSLLEKIIFVADMAEEGRTFPGADKIRETARKSLDAAVYMCADQTIRFNEAKGGGVHENAYAVREYFKKSAQNAQ